MMVSARDYLLADHDLGRFDGNGHGVSDLQSHVFNRAFSDGSHKIQVADLHDDFCHCLAFMDFGHISLKLIARAEFHDRFSLVFYDHDLGRFHKSHGGISDTEAKLVKRIPSNHGRNFVQADINVYLRHDRVPFNRGDLPD